MGKLAQPFSDVQEQARATLTILREQFSFDRWMISRLDADQLVVEYVEPTADELTPGTRFPWSQTICARMVRGDGPRVARSVATVPAYATAPMCRELGLGAYAGTPIYDQEGRLWGTLCATHPTALEEPEVDEAYLHWMARSLATCLAAAPAPTSDRRRPGPSTLVDAPTWATLLHKEHERCVRTRQQACVIELDLASALTERVVDTDPDALLDHAAGLLALSARGSDFLSRAGTSRLRLLAVNCPADDAHRVLKRLLADLSSAGINATASVVDVLPREDHPAADAAGQSGAITYMACGQCRRRGAYVSPRFPVLRCKYCGLRLPLAEPDWQEALRTAR